MKKGRKKIIWTSECIEEYYGKDIWEVIKSYGLTNTRPPEDIQTQGVSTKEA